MIRPRKVWVAAAIGAVTVAALTATAAIAGQDPGFKTAEPAMVVPLEPGVVIDKILSVGPFDVVGGYQMSGVPDGLGAYKDKHGTVQVLMNHELGRTFPAVPPGVDARISKLTLNRDTHGVLAGTYLFNGSEGFERFCSSTLEVIKGTPYYFTGEEAVDVGHDGSSIVMNAETGEWRETPHFGHMQHENIVPIERIKKFMVVTTDDDFVVGRPAYLYAYIADSFEDAVSGEDSKGSLYVWKAQNPAVVDLLKGQTIPGEFVEIPDAVKDADDDVLKATATGLDAFKFARLEDAATAQQHPGRVYFADTGKAGANVLRGALYQLDIDPSDPTQASLTLLLDGEQGDNLFRPDNIDTSAHSVVIQEDGGQNRVHVYDIKTGGLRQVAQTPDVTWETSGVINAQTFFGHGWWLMDVQAHNMLASQPGAVPPGVQPVPNTAMGEDGQLLAVYIPNS